MRRTNRIAFLPALLCAAAFTVAGAPQPPEVRNFDFADPVAMKNSWVCGGKQFGVPLTDFYIVNCPSARNGRALAVSAKKSSGLLVTQVPESVWRKFPVLRWRWRVIKKVSFTGKEPDDQAAAVYFGDGTMLRKFMVGYRWEHASPLGDESQLAYVGGTLVRRICMRNAEALTGKWYLEERNVVEDFRRAFGRLPQGNCGLTIGGNSQYSGSETLVQIDFIEFCSVGEKAGKPPVQDKKTSERKNDK
ncbi:MAG: DUF3047 domain-containing protein [Lentisphaeria bacterium]|nr:DUF3047 domain-containing protein [Lentisphaeria bacterium]